MAKLTIPPIPAGFGAVDALNDRFDLIESAIEDTVSRSGKLPNQMAADLDMNSNDILNTKDVYAQRLVLNGVPVVPSETTSIKAEDVFFSPSGNVQAKVDGLDTEISNLDSYISDLDSYVDSLQVDSIAALRLSALAVDGGTQVSVGGYYGVGDGGGGMFYYDDSDATTSDNGGTVIVDALGRRWKRLYSYLINAKWFGLREGGTANDNATALQSALLEGDCFVPEGTYSVNGVQLFVSGFTFNSGRRLLGAGKYNTTLVMDTAGGKLFTVGNGTNNVDQGITFETIGFRVDQNPSDDGCIDLKFCRNFAFRDIYVSAPDSVFGRFVNLNRSYQATFEEIYGRALSLEFMTIGSNSPEVLDTFTFRNIYWHGNYFMFIRPGIGELHGLVFINAKFRDLYEAGRPDQGETTLSAGAAAGATSLSVVDGSQLTVSAGTPLYVGVGTSAEVVEVASIATNTVTLARPTKFAHSSTDPVVVGPVFVTLALAHNVNVSHYHAEGARVGLVLHNCRSVAIANYHNASRYGIRLDSNTRVANIDQFYFAGAGYVGTLYGVHIPSYFNLANTIDDVILSRYDADAGLTIDYVANDSSFELSGAVLVKMDRRLRLSRAFSMTFRPRLYNSAHVLVDNNIGEVIIEAAETPGQTMRLEFQQDGTGGYIIVGFASNILFAGGGYTATTTANKRDILNFQWDGANWVETSRSMNV